MPYEHTSLTASQAATIQLLVSQVSRAFFDPPYTVILERLMQTRDLWGEMELTHAVGLGQAKKELHKFMVGLIKQRLVKSYVNTERKLDQAIVNGKFTRPNVQRTYYYIDYHDFTDVVKYRLAVMRQKLEATLKVEVNQNDYVCPLCKKQFNQLDVASLVALSLSSNSSSNSAFDLNCDVCGTEIVQKSKVSGAQQAGREMDVVNARMQRFNEQTMGIRGTLQKMEKIRYEKIDPLAWLIRHIPETVVFELDEDGNPIKGSDVLKPKDLAAAQAAAAAAAGITGGMVVVEDEEAKKQREEETRRLAERQKMQNALPVWHTHSTISGDQTGLGISHELLRQSRAPNGGQNRSGNGAGGVSGVDEGGAEQDDLSAYYASLNAQPVGGETSTQQATKHEAPTVDSTTAAAARTGREDAEEDDEMVDVSGGLSAASRPPPPSIPTDVAAAEEDEFEETPMAASACVSGSQAPTDTGDGDVDPGTVVMGACISLFHYMRKPPVLMLWYALVNGEPMTFAQVQDNEDLLDQMTADEYSVRTRL
ncbi:hypothetical protein QFC24_003338 [Naganishia onofrii]|uniref:Uncharacterized protein n=1 Tax=Naganishia onofrii TaxID=1851511 RepID=A0ACC2XMF0_9TREE|nr:hypothetical protein QFC24_003338 [Naganishia onofrii]